MGSHARRVLGFALLLPGLYVLSMGQGRAQPEFAADSGPGVVAPNTGANEAAVQWPKPCQRGAPGFQLPVARDVVDWFRPPATEWGAGNRGWEFATVGGERVCAVGAGTVTFAGQVAGRGVVSIGHGNGVISSVTGLASVSVASGSHVVAGEYLGEALLGLHVGFRLNGRYIDPATVFAAPGHAILVPIPGG